MQCGSNVDEHLDINLYEEHGEGHWKICIGLESNMAVTHLQVVERQNSLGGQCDIKCVAYLE